MSAYVTPLVAKLAAEHGVDLDHVKGTGVGGRIRKDDVLAAAGKLEHRAPTRFAMPRTPSRGAAYALNPLADRIRAQAALDPAQPAPRSLPPTLFAGGDLPAWTASGIEPSALLDVPWQARHALAEAPTRAAALAIRDQCSGPDAADTAVIFYGDHPGNTDYGDRIAQWQVQGLSDGQLANSALSGAADERSRREWERYRQ
jgi:Pyruvate/2-oxoglutarate dehydrogenase complex, dihydrolipoamide acyltransferase (E2) component, and related enzymes